jgi:hypothetical protein
MIKTEQEHREDLLDDAIEDTFPASDAPGNTVETGIGIAPPLPGGDADAAESSRSEIPRDGRVAGRTLS